MKVCGGRVRGCGSLNELGNRAVDVGMAMVVVRMSVCVVMVVREVIVEA